VPVHVVDAAPPRATAVVALTTTWDEFPAVWASLLDEVYAVVRARPELAPEQGPGPVWRSVMLYKDDVPSVEVGVLVGATFAPEGRVVPSELPGGRVVVATHRGDYAQLGRAHEAVHRFRRGARARARRAAIGDLRPLARGRERARDRRLLPGRLTP
jgi:hypothetical protein